MYFKLINMKDLTEREDIFLLVNSFYTLVRKDAILGPVFNTLIREEDWPMHLERMADFWECNLLFRPTFKGNPIQTHRFVDANYNYHTNQAHYDQWVKLWCQTVDEHFVGEKSALAKIRAKKMGSLLFTKVVEVKPLFNLNTE